MIHFINNYKFKIWAEPAKGGFFGCYLCPCGYEHCSSHVESEERAIITAKGQAYTHYHKDHSNNNDDS